MRIEPRPARKDTPHPLLTIGGLLVVLALVVISLKTTLLPRSYTIMIAICFVIFFRWLSRRSAKAARVRREAEIERLRRTPVLGLDD